MALFFSLTTPVGITIGIGISSTYKENSPTALIVEGVFSSTSAGILIYMALVDLLAADFMAPECRTVGSFRKEKTRSGHRAGPARVGPSGRKPGLGPSGLKPGFGPIILLGLARPAKLGLLEYCEEGDGKGKEEGERSGRGHLADLQQHPLGLLQVICRLEAPLPSGRALCGYLTTLTASSTEGGGRRSPVLGG
ncbi:hypothetical protein EJ110_NYTH49935 [Nymphaea thermarum]|nr:hypothetical protein EJ110_NYTH49935 [Nymphaea thermarum]